MTPEQLEDLGQIVESASNFHAAGQMPLPPQMHLTCLRDGMEAIRDNARRLYFEVSGEDPWADHPSFPPLSHGGSK